MRIVRQNEVYDRITNAVRSVVASKSTSFSVNVFNDLTAIVQVNVSVNNMRASLLACVKQNDDGSWSVSDNNTTIKVDDINSVGTTITRMVTRIRSLRSRLN